MRIKNILKEIFYKVKGQEHKFVSKQLSGFHLKVIPGTIRGKVDQDDAWWFYLAKHHDVIFDIGCNIGYTALLALIQNPDKRIVLVDPNPKALGIAALNIIENGLGHQAQYFSAFVGNKLDDEVKFYTVGSGAAGSMHPTHAQTASSMNSFINVKTVTLDYLYRYYDVKPDLVKIDVEGAETLVMEAAINLAKETQCSFFIEMHDIVDLGMEASGQMMIDWCKEQEYKAWYLKTGEELTNAETIKTRGKCHLLLMPKEKLYPDYLKGVVQNATLPETI
ncbi:FkbM family methyltransferase [Xanthomarina spongicola]|uniref:FkbM family methyltransferase n=1 Tax=Xanthomarina spongicola TaxID=570520 RepID=A0A316DL38_9FLAO|nr:FkbM family methyltransferase [Xanthomarina spongicola]PWK18615.1 FkbM family methyltransferase [Xanthomarina spongicola]